MIASRLGIFCHRLAQRRVLHAQSYRIVLQPLRQPVRCINTTKKKDDHHIEVYDPEYVDIKKPRGPETAKEFADVSSQKNWISYGFDYVNKKEDRLLFHMYMFSFLTVCMIGFSWWILYLPDVHLKDWALREAFLELDRRERLGLPLIDPNLIDPAKINLPSDEELGDYEVYT